MNKHLKKLVLAALFLSLAMVLPFLTGQIKQLGNAILPMHIPVLLCGFLCGPIYGVVVGFISPLLRFLMFGMPPIFPEGVSMAFELLTYGFLSGILYRKFPKTNKYIYISLLCAMIGGRFVWGIVRYVLSQCFGIDFSFALFASGTLLSAIPGIVLQIIIIPAIVMLLKKAGVEKDV